MANKLPQIFTGSKICIICEGDEEYEYLEKLISLDVWSKNYCFQLENAEGNGNIPARYQDKFQNGSYDLVLIFCDTDKKPYEQYADVVLISHNKKKNAPIIFNFTGVGGYKGKAEQRRELFSRITRENYQEMQKRIKNLPSDDAVEGSTNFGKFIEYFSMDDSRWIQMINKTLEGELYQ